MNHNTKAGISIIIPTYNSIERIKTCLDCVTNQDLDHDLFELIVVVNGSNDGTFELVSSYTNKIDINFQILNTPISGASHARNLGVEVANFEYIVFLDDDDKITSNYLSILLNKADHNTLALCPVINSYQGILSDFWYKNLPSLITDLMTKIRFITMNAGKIIPKWLLVKYKFNENIQSSEDMITYSTMLISENIDVIIVPYDARALYLREIRANSLSRQDFSADFAIIQRVKVIKAICTHITNYYQLLKPRKLLFLITRIVGEIFYCIRIILRSILK